MHGEKWSIKCKQIKLPDGPAKFIPVMFSAPLKCFLVLSHRFPALPGDEALASWWVWKACEPTYH